MIWLKIIKIIHIVGGGIALAALLLAILGEGEKQPDEIRARIERNKESTEDAYRLIEEMCEDERQ